ncbi:hypothetical protein SI65_00800 [Aspergillus cristatus]|uniref:Uncharacterized protein n=1 Tax=Aspergillus cristatus TaxID=573508 RepID=A0A1E3BR03_ASPCR|nr:hypothetical protein SI65_00800 [Aspergillus cristatus]
MIPPCDPTILESNPQFKRLYQQLTTTVLNSDGSTRANDAQPARQEVLEDLNNCRVRHAKRQIEKQTLRRLAFDPESGLADEYRDIVAIIVLYLETPRGQIGQDIDDPGNSIESSEASSLLAPDIEAFYANIPILIPSFSNALTSAIDDLRAITDTDSSTAEPKEPPRTPRVRTRQATTRSTQQALLNPRFGERLWQLRQAQLSELPTARRQMAATAAEVLAARAQVLERTVVLLERAKHGALSRATKAKAEHLATVAQGIEGKLGVIKLDIGSTIYTPETISALTRYKQHLQVTRERLEERRELAMEELNGKSGSGPLGDITRQYADTIKEMDAVETEIKSLEK